MKIYNLSQTTPLSNSYQRYYQLSIVEQWPFAQLYGFSAPTTYYGQFLRAVNRISRGRTSTPVDSEHTALYRIEDSSKTAVFAIDAHDHHELNGIKFLPECDFYFKSNYWGGVEYPVKVYPIVNGSGVLNQQRIQRLRNLRGRKKKYDLVFISRIWGGIEHNVRCFEALAKIPGNNILIAVFPLSGIDDSKKYSKDREKASIFLKSIGILCIEKQIPLYKLWESLSLSKVVFIRAGKHLCIPWRMLDLLAMGSAITTDARPYPLWPEPLVEGRDYVTAGINRPKDTEPANEREYESVTEVITRLLGDRQKQSELSVNAATYFDRYASPTAVGNYLKEILIGS